MVRRRYPDEPVLAVGVVIRDGECIVLICRHTEPAKGRWTFPGGVVRVGETIRQAARREALEETGLCVDTDDLITAVDSVVRDENGRIRYHYVIIDVAAHPVGGELRPGSDASDARWVNLATLPGLDVTEGAAEVFRQVLLHPPGV